MRRANLPRAILRNHRARFGDDLTAAKFPKEHEVMGAGRDGFRNARQHGRFRQGCGGRAQNTAKSKRAARSLRHGTNG